MKGVTLPKLLWWFHDLHFDRAIVHQSFFEPTRYRAHCLCTKEHHSHLKPCLFIISYNIVPTVCHKNLVSQLSGLVHQCLHAHIPIHLFYFIMRYMFRAKSTTSITSLPYGALLTLPILVWIARGSNLNPCPNHWTNTISKSLSQKWRILPLCDGSNSEECKW